jgi:hypothetical protein
VPWRVCLLGVAGAASLASSGGAAARTEGAAPVNGAIVVGGMWPPALRGADDVRPRRPSCARPRCRCRSVVFAQGRLVVVRPDGRGGRMLARLGVGGIVDGVEGGGNIAWSADGGHITAVRNVNAGTLVIVPLHGRAQAVRLPRDGFPENENFGSGDLSDPVDSWSPDGRRLLYAAENRLCTVASGRAGEAVRRPLHAPARARHRPAADPHRHAGGHRDRRGPGSRRHRARARTGRGERSGAGVGSRACAAAAPPRKLDRRHTPRARRRRDLDTSRRFAIAPGSSRSPATTAGTASHLQARAHGDRRSRPTRLAHPSLHRSAIANERALTTT